MEFDDRDFEEFPLNESNDNLKGLFVDIERKPKAIAETLQGQIDEMRQRIEALENKLEMQSKNKA